MDKDNIIVLPQVEKLDVDTVPIGTYALVENEGTVKRFNLNQGIIQHINHLSDKIGIETNEIQNIEATGIYKQIIDTNERINNINTQLGSSAEKTGIYQSINVLNEQVKDLQNTNVFKGYQIEFINTDDTAENLLKENAIFSYDFNPVIKETVSSINSLILNHNNYLFELCLGLLYIPNEKITNTIVGEELNYTAIFDLNSIYHSSNKNSIIQLPFTNTILVFTFDFSGNTIKFSIKGTKDTDKIKDNEIFINHGVFKAHMLESI